MMGRWCIGSMCDGKNGHRMLCSFFFICFKFVKERHMD
ncbi:hypothetical protein BCA_0834 [Bacillus cereus 03BB102]|uniref:Uncharacterized protein n=1 Tax=Bacillus cereus (strain 03BB102) TaxID=572264 RepID=A0A158RGT8_BACC3|nr:hypothetical protein BCA_0834 [Bacillus cereus 03BB102]